MDLQTGLIGLVIVVVLAVAVYLISVLGIKEKSYEEAIAEQRQRLEDESSTTNASKSASKDGAKRSKRLGGRKSKQKGGGGGANEELHVGFKVDPEIIPDDDDEDDVDDDDDDDDEESQQVSVKPVAAPVHASSKSSKRVEEPKSILVRKEKEKSPAVVTGKNNQPPAVTTPKTQQPAVTSAKNQQPAVTTSKTQLPAVSPSKNPPPAVIPSKNQQPKHASKGPATPVAAAATAVAAVLKQQQQPSVDKKDKTMSPPLPIKKEDHNDRKREVKSSKERELKQMISCSTQTVPLPMPKQASEEAPKSVRDFKRATQSAERIVAVPAERKTAKRAKYDDDAVSAQRLTTLLRAAVLSHTELQSLIELLLNRQQSNAATDSEWLRAGQRTDPLSALRKQLVERDELLAEERARSLANVQKLREVRQDLQTEKSRLTQAERTLKESRQELQAQLQTQEAKTAELGAANKKLAEEIKRARETLQQFEAEYGVAKRDKQDLSDTIRQLEVSLATSVLDGERLQNEMLQLQERIAEEQRTHEQDAADLGAKLYESEQDKTSVLSELSAIQSRVVASESEQAVIGQRLNEIQAIAAAHEVTTKQLDSLVIELRAQLVDQEKQLAASNFQLQEEKAKRISLDKELLSIRDENEMLASQLSQLSERQEAEGHEGSGGGDSAVVPSLDKTNGHIEHAEKNGEQTKILLLEHETILHEKEKLVDQLSHQIQDLSGLLCTARAETSRLLDEVETQKTKNNALREKNWKAMEALGLTEKSANERIKKVEQTWTERLSETQRSEQNLAQDLLERLFPTIEIEKSVVHDEWMLRFEKQALLHLEEVKSQWASTNSALSTKVDELHSRLSGSEENCSRLEAEVQHFKTVLAETVGILNRLQSSVESEESQWRDKLDAKEQELEKLTDEKKVLMDKLEEVTVAQQTVAEMGTKLQLLKQDLNEAAEVERRLLESERDQARVLVEQVNAQLTEVKVRVQAVTGERDLLLERVHELEEVGEELSQLKLTNRELEAEVVQLTGQLKSGVDALNVEQKRVLELSSKLECPAANGPATEQILVPGEDDVVSPKD